MMRWYLRVAISLLCLLPCGLLKAEVRTWTEKFGQVKFEGELIELSKSRITLKLTNGETKGLPIVALSPADRFYLSKLPDDVRKKLMGDATTGNETKPANTAGKIPSLKVNDKISVDWKGKWYPATIVEIRKDGYKIHYDGYSDSWDEVVKLDRMRLRNSDKPLTPATTTDSGGTKTQTPKNESVYAYRIEPKLKVGDKVIAEWKENWNPATVVEVSLPEGYKVHWETFQTPDEVVPFERLRPRDSSKPFARFLVNRPPRADADRVKAAEVISEPNTKLLSLAPTAKPGDAPTPTEPFAVSGDEVVIDLRGVTWFNLPAHAMKTGLPLVAPPAPEKKTLPEKSLPLGACESINGVLTYGDEMLVAGVVGGKTNLVSCDFRKGAVANLGAIAGNQIPLDADPTTGQIITRVKDDLSKISIWKTKGAEKVVTLRLKTFDPAFIKEEFVNAKFLTGNRVALDIGFSLWDRHTIVYDIAKRTIVVALRGCRPGVSADRRYLAVTNGMTVAVYDTVELSFAAVMEHAAVTSSFLSFSPDSKWLVYVAESEAVIFSMATGQRVTALSYQGAVPYNYDPIWLPDNHLLLGNMMLFNFRAGMQTWNFSLPANATHDAVTRIADKTCYVAQEGTAREGRIPRFACSVKLPHAKINESIRKIGSSAFALQPGAEVAIDVAMDNAEQQKRVYDTLKKAAEASGWKVVPHAKAVIRGTVEFPDGWYPKLYDDQWRYHFVLMIRTRVFRVTIDIEDHEIWRNSTTATPTMLFVSDITRQQYKDRFLDWDYAFFDQIRFPTHLPAWKHYGGFGVTRLTPDGKL